LGQRLEGLVKGQPFLFHHELDHVAADAAGEALVELVHHVDGERGALFAVERAETHVAVGAAAPQTDVFADYADDVDRRLELFDEIHGDWEILSPTAIERTRSRLPSSVSLPGAIRR